MNDSESVDLPLEVDQRIHYPDSDSSNFTSESVNLMNLDSMDYGCEICLEFSTNLSTTIESNYSKVLEKIKKLVNILNNRYLTPLGKIAIRSLRLT